MNRMESPEAQLMELLRSEGDPSDADRDRVRRNIAAKLAASAAVSATLLAAEHGSWYVRFGALSTWIKTATVATALVTAASGIGYLGTRATPPPPVMNSRAIGAPKSQAPVSKALAQVATTGAQAPALTTDGAATTTAARETSAAVPQAVGPISSAKLTAKGNTSGLEAELELLGKAQQALKLGSPSEAIRALDEHQRRFPAGVLSFERAGVRTVALCQSGRLDEGRAAARSYLRKVPNSVLSKRIRVTCQLGDE